MKRYILSWEKDGTLRYQWFETVAHLIGGKELLIDSFDFRLDQIEVYQLVKLEDYE